MREKGNYFSLSFCHFLKYTLLKSDVCVFLEFACKLSPAQFEIPCLNLLIMYAVRESKSFPMSKPLPGGKELLKRLRLESLFTVWLSKVDFVK